MALKNDAVAGMLNATFGNVVEMMITVNTLRARKILELGIVKQPQKGTARRAAFCFPLFSSMVLGLFGPLLLAETKRRGKEQTWILRRGAVELGWDLNFPTKRGSQHMARASLAPEAHRPKILRFPRFGHHFFKSWPQKVNLS